MGLHVEIDRDVCMGSGNCVFQAPGTFELDDDGIAVVLDATAAPEESVRIAAARCPSKAITVSPPS
jgi:ferredoxin